MFLIQMFLSDASRCAVVVSNWTKMAARLKTISCIIKQLNDVSEGITHTDRICLGLNSTVFSFHRVSGVWTLQIYIT